MIGFTKTNEDLCFDCDFMKITLKIFQKDMKNLKKYIFKEI